MEKIQEQEVLIARNNETGQVGAVVEQNADGTPQMADTKTTKLSDLVKFNKHQNPLEAFMSNFLRQVKNPTLFGFFKLGAEQYDAIAPAMSDMLQDPKANADLLKPYQVGPQSMVNEMKQTEKSTPVDPDKVDWEGIEKQWGVTKTALEELGALKAMLYNHKSPQLIAVRFEMGGEKFATDARLSFRTNADGTVSLIPHFIKKGPQLDRPLNGYTFTKEDKEALKTYGNLGKAVEMADPKTGEMKKHLVSVDRLTNDITAIPVDKVYVKNKIGNTELSMKEIGILKEGGIVRNKEIELANGRKFVSDLQYNADKRDIEFVKAQTVKQTVSTGESREQRNSWVDSEGNPKRITKWKETRFTDEQIADYVAGKKIEVGDALDKKGQPCKVFLQFDKEKQRPVTQYKYEVKKTVKDELQKGQTTSKDDSQTKQQRKTKSPKL